MRLLLAAVALASTLSLAQDTSCRRRPKPTLDTSILPLGMGDRQARLSAALKTDLVDWGVQGQGYELRCDEVGSNCLTTLLRSKAWGRATAGALLHRESALPWRGATVELSADLRAGAVQDKAGLVIIVEDAEGKVLATARGTPLSGTTSFAWHSVRLEVPQGAEKLLVGVELVGAGAVFVREVGFDEPERPSATR